TILCIRMTGLVESKSLLVLSTRRELIPILVLCFTWGGVQESCFTVDLALDNQVIMRSADSLVRLNVRIGGAAGDATKVSLSLRKADGAWSAELTPASLGQGRYVAVVRSAFLPGGIYEATFVYRRFTLDLNYPFWHSQVRRTEAFLVQQ